MCSINDKLLLSAFLFALSICFTGSVYAFETTETHAATTGCSHINVFDVAPRQQQLYAVRLLSIDEQAAGPSGTKSYRINAGSHTLTLAEQIDPAQLSFNSRERNATENKTLTIHVAPNTTYYVAARLNSDKRSEWKDGAYWDPIVWKETAEECH